MYISRVGIPFFRNPDPALQFEEIMPPTIGMIIALPSEAAHMAGRRGWRKRDGYAFRRQALPGGIDLLIGLSGMGIGNARGAARRLVEQGAAALVNTGISGGLVAGLRPGNLAIAESVFLVDAGKVLGTWRSDRDAAAQAAGRLAAGGIPSHCGRIVCSVKPVLSAAVKKEYGESFQSLAVDMESAGVAMAAEEAGLPFFIMRAVCDPFTQSIPPWLFDNLSADGSFRLTRLGAEVARHPATMIDLLRMAIRFRRACGALADAWALLCSAGISASFLPQGGNEHGSDNGSPPHRNR
jgi:adenosylhomocysteine nucleosidase